MIGANAFSIRRRRTPTRLQHETAECGVACLAMICAHHGLWLSIEELREVAGVNRDGTKASALVKAAARYGLAGRGLSCEPDHLRDLPLPAVLFWNFNHYVVLEQIDRRSAFINDPALGPRRLPTRERRSLQSM